MTGFYVTLDSVPLSAEQPLLVVDADEVLFLFVAGFEAFLTDHNLVLDLSTYRLHGNVKRRATGEIVASDDVTALLSQFRRGCDDLSPVPGAIDAVRALGADMNIVVLSNVAPDEAPARLRNLVRIGLPFPLAINAGPKGPALAALAARAKAPAFFVDDIPAHLASAAEHAPDVYRIHFVGDVRLKTLLPPSPHAHFHAREWHDAECFIRDALGRRSP